MLRQLLIFTYWLPKHPVFWFTPNTSVRPTTVNYPLLCSTYVAYRMPCHAIGHQVLPIQARPREAEDFPRGGNYSRHMRQLTYLAWLQPICYNLKFVFKHVKTEKVLLAVKVLIKKHRAAATLISSHESIGQQPIFTSSHKSLK